MPQHRLSTRSAQADTPLSTRMGSMQGMPSSMDGESRSLRVVMTTEQPVMVFDWERYENVPEVILASGMKAPASGQVPFLDGHNRSSVENVLGSARDFQPVTAGGFKGVDALVGFSATPEGESAMRKFAEGHLTDVSVGYAVLDRTYVEPGATAMVEGKNYTGPMSVVTSWELKELSAAPIGADDLAKARSKYQRQGGEKTMKITVKLRKLLVVNGLRADATDEQAQTFLAGLSESVRAAMVKASEGEGLEFTSMGIRMDPELRKYLCGRGMDPAFNDAQAEAFMLTMYEDKRPTQDPGRAAPLAQMGEDPAVVAARAIKEERERAVSIRAMCSRSGLSADFAEKLVNEGVSMDKSRELMLEEIATRSRVLGGHIEGGPTDSEKFRAAAVDGLAMRVRGRLGKDEKPAPGYEEFRALGLRKLAETCLERAGVHVRSLSNDQVAALSIRGFASGTTSDFPAIMSGLANKVARQAYQEAPATWRPVVKVSSAPDFKSMERPQLSSASSLDLVGEDGEYKEGKFSDQKEAFKIHTYGKLFSLTRQTIINDDLGMFLRLPMLFGAACQRKISDIVYNDIILGNPLLNADGTALFDSSKHNNLGSKSGVVKAAMDAGRSAMRLQKDPGGSLLNLTPRMLLVPAALQTDAETILQSPAIVASGMSAGVKNVYYNALDLIVEARLDADSGQPWFQVADPYQIDTIEVSFLDGREEPWIEQELMFNTDGVKFKVRLDVGAAPMDFRGFYKTPSK